MPSTVNAGATGQTTHRATLNSYGRLVPDVLMACQKLVMGRTVGGMATSLHLPMVTSSEQHRDEIEGLHARILACQACREAGHIEAANPLRHPWTPRQQTMIVGQAPGAQTEAFKAKLAPTGLLLATGPTAAQDQAAWRAEYDRLGATLKKFDIRLPDDMKP